MNLRAYADHRKSQGLRGTSHVAVLKAIESGRLTEPAVRKVNGGWVIDPSAADAQWADNTIAVVVADSAPEKAQPPVASAQPRQTPSLEDSMRGPSLAEAKRAQAVYKAERERLALLKEKGELVSAAEVKARWFEHGRAIRDNLMSVPDRIAAQLAATTDTREAHLLLSQEITGALRVLADG